MLPPRDVMQNPLMSILRIMSANRPMVERRDILPHYQDAMLRYWWHSFSLTRLAYGAWAWKHVVFNS